MKICTQSVIIVLGLSVALLLPAQILADGGTGGESSATRKVDPALAQAKVAIEDKDWDKAIKLLNLAVARDNSNAYSHNLLGYAERKRGNLDTAFKHYERALTLDPEHRGAHEYIGEAYLMAGNLPKAEEHLAILDKLCFFSCEEYSDLEAAIAAYKGKRSQ